LFTFQNLQNDHFAAFTARHGYSRNIFYDTDGIQETQQETVRVCECSGGALRIDSTASTGRHVLAIHIPQNACEACKQAGYEWFESGKSSTFDALYLQDRTIDSYIVQSSEKSS
jgi:hypothetical protein